MGEVGIAALCAMCSLAQGLFLSPARAGLGARGDNKPWVLLEQKKELTTVSLGCNSLPCTGLLNMVQPVFELC